MIVVNIDNIGAKVRATPLTGLDTALTGVITSTDTVLQAFGKIQNQITNIPIVSPGGANRQVQWNNNGVFGASPELTFFGTNRLSLGYAAPVDAGFRLDVNGTVRIVGTGTTSATGPMTVQNSANPPWFYLRDNKTLRIASDPTAPVGSLPNVIELREYTVGGISVYVKNVAHNGATGIYTSSAIGLRAVSTIGVSANNPMGASIYAEGGASSGNISLGLLSNRALITSTANGLNMHNSAMLQVDSTTRGFLMSRMTAAQAEAITSPAEGLLIFSTDNGGVTINSKGFWYWDSSTWVKL